MHKFIQVVEKMNQENIKVFPKGKNLAKNRKILSKGE